MNLEMILVPLDGSVVAEAALAPAVDLARQARAKLVLLRAAEAHTRPLADPIEDQVDVMRETMTYLEATRARVMAAGVADVEVAAWYGPAVKAIVDTARYRGADLIVMSSHGRSGVARLVMGSVTERVRRGTSVPVLVIRPDGAPIDAPSMGVPPAKEVSHA